MTDERGRSNGGPDSRRADALAARTGGLGARRGAEHGPEVYDPLGLYPEARGSNGPRGTDHPPYGTGYLRKDGDYLRKDGDYLREDGDHLRKDADHPRDDAARPGDGAGHVRGGLAARLGADDSRRPLRARWDPVPDDAETRREGGRRGAIRRFVSTYGWRAYALPVLAVITVLVIADAVKGGGDPDGIAAPGPGRLSQHTDKAGIIGAPPKGDGSFSAELAGALPDGGPFAETGTGAWHPVHGSSAQIGAAQGHLFTYTVEVEDGVDTTAMGGEDAVARMVEATLSNPKSWIHDPKFGFRRIDAGEPDFRISLTSRQTTKTMCGFEIPIDSSCYNADAGRVVLSDVRWVRGAPAFEGDIGSYRQYQINHEVGHAIGYHDHQPCETDGGLAPVMMQQTFGTRNSDIAALDPEGVVPMDGRKCRFNPWPYPRG